MLKLDGGHCLQCNKTRNVGVIQTPRACKVEESTDPVMVTAKELEETSLSLLRRSKEENLIKEKT